MVSQTLIAQATEQVIKTLQARSPRLDEAFLHKTASETVRSIIETAEKSEKRRRDNQLPLTDRHRRHLAGLFRGPEVAPETASAIVEEMISRA